MGLGDVPKLLAAEVGFVEGNHARSPLVATMMAWV